MHPLISRYIGFGAYVILRHFSIFRTCYVTKIMLIAIGAIQVLHNAAGSGRVSNFQEKALRNT